MSMLFPLRVFSRIRTREALCHCGMFQTIKAILSDVYIPLSAKSAILNDQQYQIWFMNTAYALPHIRPGSCRLLGSEPARIAMFEARILWSCRSATIWNWCRAVGWSMGGSCKTSSNGQSSRSTAPSSQGEEFCRMSSACNQSCLQSFPASLSCNPFASCNDIDMLHSCSFLLTPSLMGESFTCKAKLVSWWFEYWVVLALNHTKLPVMISWAQKHFPSMCQRLLLTVLFEGFCWSRLCSRNWTASRRSQLQGLAQASHEFVSRLFRRPRFKMLQLDPSRS